VVSAIAPGEAVITATTSNGLKAECAVTVTAKTIPATGITLSETTLNLVEGNTATLTTTVDPEAATDKTVTWSTSNESVATVENGVVTAVAPGEAIITATTSNGLKAECVVTVTAKIVLATSISLDKEYIEGLEGDEIQLTATVLPDDATDKSVTWSSSDESVATVDENGLVTIIGIGSATITVSTNDGSELTASCHIYGVSGIEAIIYQAGGADVYTVNGVLLKLHADNEYISTLARGVYIIRIEGRTYKIAK
ncbi:MAG: Ig-like domain-containing protein, partial [Muribaculaceae bacterium]|nr:Ig-like domain-containing protein [Muribaculaceae bacterium]